MMNAPLKTLWAAVVLVCSCWSGFCQGVVQFRNYWAFSTPPVDAPVYYDFVGGLPLSGDNPYWRAALIGGPTDAKPASTSSAGTLSAMYSPVNTTLSWVNFRSGSTPPIASGYVAYGATPQRVVPGVDWGQTAMVQMVAWEGPYTSWVDAWTAVASGATGVRVGWSNPLLLPLASSMYDTNLTYLCGLQPFALNFYNEEPPPHYYCYISGPPDTTVNAGDQVSLSIAVDARPPPFGCKWYFNGSAIPGTNSYSYDIHSAGPGDAGEYYAIVAHETGSKTSRVAKLTVVTTPIIRAQPQDQTVVQGKTAVFEIAATGVEPLSYQWSFNSTIVPDGTGSRLTVDNAQFSDIGAYTAILTNTSGAVTSAPAMLNVVPPVELAAVPAVYSEQGPPVHLESAEQLPARLWQPMGQMLLATNGGQPFVQIPASTPGALFYRAWHTNDSIQPTLSITMVPAITLRGAIGGSVQIEYIRQFDPTNAWVTLATVQLTNTSQLYIDTSAIGQPPRVYRIIPVR